MSLFAKTSNESHFMKTLATWIFRYRVISFIAIIFIAIEAFPAIVLHPNPVIFIKIVLWIIGATFLWLKKDWAAIYLACLAIVYFITDIILPISQVITAIRSLSPQLLSHNRFIPHLIILSMIIEVVFLLCFIYYGITVFRNRAKKK